MEEKIEIAYLKHKIASEITADSDTALYHDGVTRGVEIVCEILDYEKLLSKFHMYIDYELEELETALTEIRNGKIDK